MRPPQSRRRDVDTDHLGGVRIRLTHGHGEAAERAAHVEDPPVLPRRSAGGKSQQCSGRASGVSGAPRHAVQRATPLVDGPHQRIAPVAAGHEMDVVEAFAVVFGVVLGQLQSRIQHEPADGLGGHVLQQPRKVFGVRLERAPRRGPAQLLRLVLRGRGEPVQSAGGYDRPGLPHRGRSASPGLLQSGGLAFVLLQDACDIHRVVASPQALEIVEVSRLLLGRSRQLGHSRPVVSRVRARSVPSRPPRSPGSG